MAGQFIDWHTNLWLPEHFDPAQHDEMHGRTGAIDASPEAHRAGVAAAAEKFVVLGLRFNQLGIRVPAAFIAEYCRQFPGRAVGFVGIDPHDEDAPAQLEHAVGELGLRGIKFSPVYSGFDPWAPEAWRIYEMANEMQVPILWHQAAAYPAAACLEYGNPIYLDKIARAFPALRMIIAHMAQPWTGELVVLLRKHEQLYSDLSARFHRKWQLYNALMLALEYKVTDRLLFGSDFPVATSQGAADAFRALNDWGEDVRLPRFPDEVIEDILHNRPLSLLWPDL